MDCTVSFSQGIFNSKNIPCKDLLKCALEFGDGRRFIFRNVEITKSFGFFSKTVEHHPALVAGDLACRLKCKIEAKTPFQEGKCQSLCVALFFSALHHAKN
jgi:hypothetical protein